MTSLSQILGAHQAGCHKSELYPPETKIVALNGSTKDNHSALIRLKCSTKQEFIRWLREHETLSGVTFRVNKSPRTVGKSVIYKGMFRCHHNTSSHHKWVKKHNKKHTGCAARLTVSIKSSVEGRRVRSQDVLRGVYPTVVKVFHEHNHPINTEEALKYKDPTDQVREKFLELFRSRYSPARALALHKQDLLFEYEDEYEKVLNDRSMCPDSSWVYRLYYKALKKGFNSTSESVIDIVSDLVSNGIKAKYVTSGAEYVIAICTPLMERAHSLDLAGRAVCCDSLGNLEKYNCHVLLLMCDSSVGGLPLGVVVSSSENECAITEGLKLLKEIIPEPGFGNPKKCPCIIIGSDCDAQLNSLQAVFPEAKVWLSTYHVLMGVWRWLEEKSHSIEQQERLELYSLFKTVTFAENQEKYTECANKLFFESPTSLKYNNFRNYAFDQLKNLENYSHRCKNDSGEKDKDDGKNSIYVESEMRVLKERVLSRSRAFNLKRLAQFLTVELSDVYCQKTIDVISANNESLMYMRETSKFENQVQDLQVLKVEDGVCLVENKLNDVVYEVNTDLGVCSCPVGLNGAPCKHKYLANNYLNESCPVGVPFTEEEEKLYFWIATGESDISKVWYDPLVNDDLNGEPYDEVTDDPLEADSFGEDTYLEDTVEEISREAFLTELNELNRLLKKGFKKNPIGYSSALRNLNVTLKTMRTENKMLTVIQSATKNSSEALTPEQPAVKIKIEDQVLCDLCGNVLQ